MFTRDQFEAACEAFARRYPQWFWVSGHRPGYGFLTRTTIRTRKAPLDLEADASGLEEEVEVGQEDSATAEPSLLSTLNVNEYIAYSASFNVPAFYFTIHDSKGTSLPLHELLQTSLFKVRPPRGSKVTDFSLTLPLGSFPLISQGDHPTLGTPCWFFHPCESETAVNEFMMDEEQSDWNQETRYGRWLEIWLMIVGSIFDV